MSKISGLRLAVEEPGRMTVLHPISGDPLRDAEGREAFISLYSADSLVAKRYNQSVTDKRLQMKRNAKLTAAELEAEAVDYLCALSSGWHLVDLEGHAIDLPFSRENAHGLYGDPACSWLREQVDAFLGNRANFSKTSSSS